MRKVKFTKKFFPFSPGIQWKVERGKYIYPYIDSETWNKSLDKKNIIVVAFGGLIESFFSLSFIEALKLFDTEHNVFWLGNPEYASLVRFQGLGQLCTINLTPDKLQDYPVPLFFDKKENAYFNVMVNCGIRKSYWGKYPELRSEPILQQIFANCMVPWQNYIPVLRKLGDDFWKELIQSAKINNQSKIIALILDETSKDSLEWNIHNIKEFAQLIVPMGFHLIVFAKDLGPFYGA